MKRYHKVFTVTLHQFSSLHYAATARAEAAAEDGTADWLLTSQVWFG